MDDLSPDPQSLQREPARERSTERGEDPPRPGPDPAGAREHRTEVEALLELLSPDDVAELLGAGDEGPCVGDRIGDYELLAPIGGGSMGDVWAARQSSLDRVVALKVLRPEIANDRTRRLFGLEARALARLEHPGIVSVYASGTTAGRMWIAQEFVAGERTLADLLDERRAARAAGEDPEECSHEDTVRFFLGIARAIDYAHVRGVVHRDLKPANVLVDESGAPRVADFGLAALREELVHTTERRLVGSPCYMSPEQVAAQVYGIDARTDVFSIGVMLQEALTLERPFDSDLEDDDLARREIFEAIATREPRPFDRERPGVPRKLQSICARCLEKDRRRRYPTVRALAEDLEAFLENRPLRTLEALGRDRSGDATGEAYSPTAGHPGQYLEHYRLGRFLARGSQGEVWEAFDQSLELPVALKIVALEGKSQAQLDRFQLEARVTARCLHPGVVRIYGNGETHGCMWIAMELVEDARTLRDVIEEEFGGADATVEGGPEGAAPRDLAAKASFFAELADALAEVHRRRIVHRDVKPSNILIGADGRGRITDFGTARVRDTAGATRADERVGTPRYMSPEQINPDLYAIDGRADVFALGVCLYEAVSGIHPFEADSAQLVQHKILHEEPLRLSRIVTRCPQDLERIVQRALAKVREDRYPSMEAFSADLLAFAEGRDIAAAPARRLRRARRWMARRRGALASAAAVALVAWQLGAAVRAGSPAEVDGARTLGRAERSLEVQRATLADLLAGRELDLERARRTLGREAGALDQAARALPGHVELAAWSGGAPRLLDGTSLDALFEELAAASLTSERARTAWATAAQRHPGLTPILGLLPLTGDPAGPVELALVVTRPDAPEAAARVEVVRDGEALWLVGREPLGPEHWAALTDAPWATRHALDAARLRERLGWSEAPGDVLARAPYRGDPADQALRPVLGPFHPHGPDER